MKINSKYLIILSLIVSSVLVSPFAIASSVSVSNPVVLPPSPTMGVPTGFPQKPSSVPTTESQRINNTADSSTPLPPTGYSVITGKVIDTDTKEPINNAQVNIPELKLSSQTNTGGQFKFTTYAGGNIEDQYVTLEVSVPGFGHYTMVDVGVFHDNIVTVTLELQKGNMPTKWFGLMRDKKRAPQPQSSLRPLPSSPATLDPYSSQTVPPPYIRVAIRTSDANGNPDPNGAVIRTDIVDFDFYVKHVLPQEWVSSWSAESLKAGAMAVKEYAWYWVNQGGKYPQYNADVDNSVNSQVYNPNISVLSTDNAVDNTVANGWYQNGIIFQSFYCAGDYNNPSQKCPVAPSNSMSQNGSRYWADQGKTYDWILNYYYSPIPTYFTIIPQRPKTYVSAVTTNSITINFSSPGATWYQVNKYVNGSWNNVIYSGSNTSLTDTNLIPNQIYYYTIAAWNSGGWGPWSYNNGHMGAVAKSASNPPAPNTNPFFITNKEIRLRTTSSDPNVTSYYVVKWNGTSWANVYYGSSNEYADTGLNSSTGYYYAVAVYDSSIGWSDFSNSNGYLNAITHLTY